jgi:hypothetical protein
MKIYAILLPYKQSRKVCVSVLGGRGVVIETKSSMLAMCLPHPTVAKNIIWSDISLPKIVL